METRRCKECGKIFIPKSKRQQYCEELHYRPCPICGKMVEAKYLSDPPRTCSKECSREASRRKRDEQKPSVSVSSITSKSIIPVSSILSNASTDTESVPTIEHASGGSLFQKLILNHVKPDESTQLTPVTSSINKPTVVKFEGDVDESTLQYAQDLRESGSVKTYIGKDILGFQHGHEYALEITKDINSPYDVSAMFDLSTMKPVDLLINLSSQISISQHFA